MDDGTDARFHPQGESSSVVGEVMLKICIFSVYIQWHIYRPTSLLVLKMTFQNPTCLLNSFVRRMTGGQVDGKMT